MKALFPTLLLFSMLIFTEIAFGQATEKPVISKYSRVGYNAMREGDFQLCITAYTEGIEAEPTAVGYYSGRAYCKSRLNDWRGVINDYDRVLEMNGLSLHDKREAYYERGMAKIKIGQKDSGCVDLSKAGEFGNTSAYNAIRNNCN